LPAVRPRRCFAAAAAAAAELLGELSSEIGECWCFFELVRQGLPSYRKERKNTIVNKQF
jgi:hypothetical protein